MTERLNHPVKVMLVKSLLFLLNDLELLSFQTVYNSVYLIKLNDEVLKRLPIHPISEIKN